MVDYGACLHHGNPAAAPHACTLLSTLPQKEPLANATGVLSES